MIFLTLNDIIDLGKFTPHTYTHVHVQIMCALAVTVKISSQKKTVHAHGWFQKKMKTSWWGPIWSWRANPTLCPTFLSFKQNPRLTRTFASSRRCARSAGLRGPSGRAQGELSRAHMQHLPHGPHRQVCGPENRLSFIVKIRKLSLSKGRALPKAALTGWSLLAGLPRALSSLRTAERFL